MPRTIRMAVAACVIALASLSAWPVAAADRIKVVASFSILGELVNQVGGERVETTTLVGPNGDAHVFSPSPADAAKVKAAQLVFVNGLGLEGWMDRFFKASGTNAPLIVASTGVKALEGGEDEHDKPKASSKGHTEHRLDPHAWQNVANVKLRLGRICRSLQREDECQRELLVKDAHPGFARGAKGLRGAV
jgi:zinc/manganese transport system substrate-binding protein